MRQRKTKHGQELGDGAAQAEFPQLRPASDLQKYLPSSARLLETSSKQQIQAASPKTPPQGRCSPPPAPSPCLKDKELLWLAPTFHLGGLGVGSCCTSTESKSSKESCSQACSGQQVGERSPAMQEEPGMCQAMLYFLGSWHSWWGGVRRGEKKKKNTVEITEM